MNFIKSFAMYHVKCSSPELVGLFSVDEHDQSRPDASQLRYLTSDLPEDGTVNVNLMVKSWDQTVDHTKRWLNYVDYLANHQKLVRGNSGEHFEDFGIFTSCVAIRDITTVDHVRHNIDFDVTCVRGNLYLRKYRGDDLVFDKHSSSGLKFQQFLFPRSHNTESTKEEVSMGLNSFFALFKINVGNHRIIYKTKIHGIDVNKNEISLLNDDTEETLIDKLKEKKFVYVKTMPAKVFHGNMFWKNTKDIYFSSFLANGDDVYIGVKNSSNTVEKISKIKTRDLENYQHKWSKDKCMKKVSQFLDMLKIKIKEEIEKKCNGENPLPPFRILLRKKPYDPELYVIAPEIDQPKNFGRFPQKYLEKFMEDNVEDV